MDLKLREPNSDTGALADQGYAASLADAARCLQSWFPRGVTLCNGGAHRSVREQRSRIRSVTVSSRLCMDFLKGKVHVKSRFSFTTEFYTSHPRLSPRYVVRWPAQPAAVADAEDKLITI